MLEWPLMSECFEFGGQYMLYGEENKVQDVGYKDKLKWSVEGWHAFSVLVGATHPTIWKFIDALRSQQNFTDLERVRFQAGQLPPPKRRRYRATQECLERVVNRYGEENFVLEEYLNGIAFSFDLQL